MAEVGSPTPAFMAARYDRLSSSLSLQNKHRKEVLILALAKRLLPMVVALVFLVLLFSATPASPRGNDIYAQQRAIAASAVARYFPAWAQHSAMNVVGCETGHTYYARAYNKSGATGLFQIIWYWHQQFNRSRLTNPYYNAWAASIISNHGRNWQPWIVGGCYP